MSVTRERLLDSTAEVLLDVGVQGLTLEAVAKQAGVSKGGLLYHFPNKQALVDGLVERFVWQFDEAMANAGSEPGAATRAYVNACVGPQPEPAGASADRLTAALLAGMLVDPHGLDPLREHAERWQRRLENDGIDPVLATTVRLAADGWWTARLLGLAPPGPELHERTWRRLHNLVDGEVAALASTTSAGGE